MAIPSIDRVARPRQDRVYGKDRPLMQVWPPRKKTAILKSPSDHSHRPRIVSASAVSICSVYRV
jgi:hypothetical protein